MSYERLEFLGDSILALLITEWLHERFPEFREGPLSQAKSTLQANNFLARKLIRRVNKYAKDNKRALNPSGILIAELPSIRLIDELQELFESRDSNDDFEDCWRESEENKKMEKKKNLEKTGHEDAKTEDQNKKTSNSILQNVETRVVPQLSLNMQKYKRVADVYESLIAATFIDSGFDIRVKCCSCLTISYISYSCFTSCGSLN